MFGVSLLELIVIFGVVLLVFGPEKLPDAARRFGRLMAELRRNSDAVRREFYNSIYTPAHDLKRRVENSARELTSVGLDEAPALKPSPKETKEPSRENLESDKNDGPQHDDRSK